MSAFAWWVPFVLATLLAIAYVTWRNRPGPPEDTHDAIEARERFRRAIENGPAGSRKSQRPASKGDEGDDAG